MKRTKKFLDLLKRDHRFTIESYRFVNEALDYAVEKKNSEKDKEDFLQQDNHVTGQDLSYAVLEKALDQFGYMARLVLANLGIKKTGDIGDIVYNLIDIEYMQKLPEDTREDFDNVFDLGKELDAGFVFRLTPDSK